jgi:hypothetical protein
MLNLKKQLLTLVGIGLGAVAGFLYWKYVGCTSGTCPITSNPTNATIYGAVMGGLLFRKKTINKK